MIKVMIERRIAPDMIESYEHAIKQTLRAILDAEGYISGSSLTDAKDPHHRVIITNWVSVEAWKRWKKSEDRQNVLNIIQPTLIDQEKITVWVS